MLQEPQPVWLESRELGDSDKRGSPAGRHLPGDIRPWKEYDLYSKDNGKQLKGLNKPGKVYFKDLIYIDWMT